MREPPSKVVTARRENTQYTQRHTCDVVSLFLFYKKLSKRPVSPRLDYINALSVLGLSARFCFPVPVLFFFFSLTWQRVWSAKNLPHPRCFSCARVFQSRAGERTPFALSSSSFVHAAVLAETQPRTHDHW